MTSEQRHKILEKLAYSCYEVYDKKTFDKFNWKKAETVLELDQKINGEDFLLMILEENNKDNT